MNVIVNGEATPLPDHTTVEMLLNELSLATKRVAVEINEEIIARSGHKQHLLRDGDIVEIIKAIGGG